MNLHLELTNLNKREKKLNYGASLFLLPMIPVAISLVNTMITGIPADDNILFEMGLFFFSFMGFLVYVVSIQLYVNTKAISLIKEYLVSQGYVPEKGFEELYTKNNQRFQVKKYYNRNRGTMQLESVKLQEIPPAIEIVKI